MGRERRRRLRHGGLLLPGKREDGSVAGRPLGVHALLFYQEGVKVKQEWWGVGMLACWGGGGWTVDLIYSVYARSGERERSFQGDPLRVRACVCM